MSPYEAIREIENSISLYKKMIDDVTRKIKERIKDKLVSLSIML